MLLNHPPWVRILCLLRTCRSKFVRCQGVSALKKDKKLETSKTLLWQWSLVAHCVYLSCCLDVYEVQGQVWIAPDPGEVTAPYLYILSTTHLQYRGAGTAGKTRPEEQPALARCEAQVSRFDSQGSCSLFTTSIPC